MEEVSYDDMNTAYNNLSLNQSIIKEITNSDSDVFCYPKNYQINKIN